MSMIFRVANFANQTCANNVVIGPSDILFSQKPIIIEFGFEFSKRGPERSPPQFKFRSSTLLTPEQHHGIWTIDGTTKAI